MNKKIKLEAGQGVTYRSLCLMAFLQINKLSKLDRKETTGRTVKRCLENVYTGSEQGFPVVINAI